MSKFRCHVCSLTACIALFGCGAPKPTGEGPVETPEQPKAVKKVRVTNRPANTRGGVFIVEYHKIAKEEARWDRSIKKFRSDLERLYKMGFRPVTLGEYVANKLDLAPGASPVVITFDDSQISQFKLRSDGTIDPDCAVGIWRDFEKDHPDFPVKATFFVLPPVPWGQKDELGKKLAYLKEWGSELGSHTMSHRQLSKLSDAEVMKELAGAQDFVASLGFPCDAIALPYGISPKNAALLSSFSTGGRTYKHKAALLVGANPAPSPEAENLNPMRLPRIQGIEGDYGITYWLDRVIAGDVSVYVAP